MSSWPWCSFHVSLSVMSPCTLLCFCCICHSTTTPSRPLSAAALALASRGKGRAGRRACSCVDRKESFLLTMRALQGIVPRLRSPKTSIAQRSPEFPVTNAILVARARHVALSACGGKWKNHAARPRGRVSSCRVEEQSSSKTYGRTLSTTHQQ